MTWNVSRTIALCFTSACLLLTTNTFAAGVIPSCESVTLTDKVDGDKPVGEKNSFTTDTAMIYLICNSENVVKGQQIKALWIADDTNNVAPANFKIDEKTLDVTANASENNVWNAKYSLSKPTAGWPVGSYHVELVMDDQVIESIKFTIK